MTLYLNYINSFKEIHLHLAMAEEMIMEVDENDNRIGLRPRSDFYGGNLIHRASHLIVLNLADNILLQKRATTKKWYPGLWEYSVSETVKDESYLNTIIRGAMEELGILVSPNKSFKYFTSDEGIDKAWRKVYTQITSQKYFPFDELEIEDVKWFNQEELKRDVKQNPNLFTPHLIKGLEIFFSP
jgi:isopentenyl-diphosphate Delta-isomerase